MHTALLVNRIQHRSLRTLLRSERGREVELEALGNKVVKFDLVAEDVGSRPGLGEGQAMNLVDPFALKVSRDEVGFGIARSLDLEGDARWGLGLDFERRARVVIVFPKQVAGRLAEILCKLLVMFKRCTMGAYLPGGGDRLG